MTTDKFLICKTQKDRRCNTSFPVRRNDQTNLCRLSLPIPLPQVTKQCMQAGQQLGSTVSLHLAVTHYLCRYFNMTATFPGLKAITLCLVFIYTYSILLPGISWSDEQGTCANILSGQAFHHPEEPSITNWTALFFMCHCGGSTAETVQEFSIQSLLKRTVTGPSY